MTTITEAVHPFAPLISREYLRSIDQVTIDQNQTIVVGQVLAKYTIAADPAFAAAANTGNTGNATIAMGGTPDDTKVKEGAYRIFCTDATHFLVQDPDSILLGGGVFGTAFANGVHFTITAGGTACVAGDGFTVQSSMTSAMELYVAHVPSATDSTATAVAIALYPATNGASVTANIAAVTREAEVRGSDLTWASGITTAQKDEATRDLKANGRNIIIR
jgi:hypothetical protein